MLVFDSSCLNPEEAEAIGLALRDENIKQIFYSPALEKHVEYFIMGIIEKKPITSFSTFPLKQLSENSECHKAESALQIIRDVCKEGVAVVFGFRESIITFRDILKQHVEISDVKYFATFSLYPLFH